MTDFVRERELLPTPGRPRPKDTPATAGRAYRVQNQASLLETAVAVRGAEDPDAVDFGSLPPLNPSWVELLLGWPKGWTDPETPLVAHLVALPTPEEWISGSWEDGVPDKLDGVPNRLQRLRAIGNGQTPVTAAAAFELLLRDAVGDDEADHLLRFRDPDSPSPLSILLRGV